jgi:hypothetical protein
MPKSWMDEMVGWSNDVLLRVGLTIRHREYHPVPI